MTKNREDYGGLGWVRRFFSRENMSDLAWAVKNGDMDQVKELVEGKVATSSFYNFPFDFTTFHSTFHLNLEFSTQLS